MIQISYTFGAWVRSLVNKDHHDVLARMQRSAVAEGSNYMLYHLVTATPTGATAALRMSTSIAFSTDRTAARVGPFGTPSKYAGFVEDGTRPHMPPSSPISYWVARKLGMPMGSPENRRATWGIMRKIARRGTKATHYQRKTWSRHRANTEILMHNAADRVLMSWYTGR